MKITVLAIGSRGDTQPYLALARALSLSGYQVRVCAGDNFADLIQSYGLEFAPLGVDLHYVVNVRMVEVLETGRNTLQALRLAVREGVHYGNQMWAGIKSACADADAVIANILGIGAYNIAEQCRIPVIWVHSTPVVGRTHHAPPMIFPIQQNMGGVLNHAAHQLTEFGLWQLLRPLVNGWRRESGMKPLTFWGWPFDQFPDRAILALYGLSQTVFPRPPDWPEHWHVTGYWFLDAPQAWQPPDKLVDFLHSGPPPVFIGFGSMANRHPEQMATTVTQALKKSGQRGILVTGWGGMSSSDSSDDVFTIDSIPHDWLFSRVAAVAHHGGVGTTAAGLRAGVPSIIVPHFGDQFYWGAQVKRLGVGVSPIPRRKLTADNLAAAFQQAVSDTQMRQRAAAVGESIRAEDGLGNAVKLIEQCLSPKN